MYCQDVNMPLEWEAHGTNVDFMSWINRKWREFIDEFGIKENEKCMYHEQFDKWLTEKIKKNT